MTKTQRLGWPFSLKTWWQKSYYAREWDIAKGCKVLVHCGRELEIGIFGSAPDSATCFNHPPFISATRCLPPWSCIGFQLQNFGWSIQDCSWMYVYLAKYTSYDTNKKREWLDISLHILILKIFQCRVLCIFIVCVYVFSCTYLYLRISCVVSMLLQMTFWTALQCGNWMVDYSSKRLCACERKERIRGD